MKTGSVKKLRSQNVSSATLCVAPGITPSALAAVVTAAYVPIRDTAPRNIHPISRTTFESDKTRARSRA